MIMVYELIPKHAFTLCVFIFGVDDCYQSMPIAIWAQANSYSLTAGLEKQLDEAVSPHFAQHHFIIIHFVFLSLQHQLCRSKHELRIERWENPNLLRTPHQWNRPIRIKNHGFNAGPAKPHPINLECNSKDSVLQISRFYSFPKPKHTQRPSFKNL